MTFKKLLIILTITVTVVIMMLLSTSYAWYQFDNAVTNFSNVQTFNENLDLLVVFANNNNINTTVGIPLKENEVDAYAKKTTFTISLPSVAVAGRDVAYEISLEDLKIDSELSAVNSLNYELLETVNGVTRSVATGNFLNVSGTSLVLKRMAEIQYLDTTYSYEFRLWLANNKDSNGQECTLEKINSGVCSNQNNLMGKKITGKIKVSTAVR